MNMEKELREKSRVAFPFLDIQGPIIDKALKGSKVIDRLCRVLKNICKMSKISLEFEPPLIEYDAASFIAGSLFNKYEIDCRQLSQYRFNPQGERIVCEFIRNKFDSNIVSGIRKKLLPICRYCCKLEVKNVFLHKESSATIFNP